MIFHSFPDTSLFIFVKKGLISYLLVSVDDLILTGNDNKFLTKVISQLEEKLSIQDLGHLFFFVCIEVIPTATVSFLSQHKYIQELLEKTKMVNVRAVQSPMSLT